MYFLEFKRGRDKKKRKGRKPLGTRLNKFVLNNPGRVADGLLLAMPKKKDRRKDKLTVGDIRRGLGR